MSNLEKIRFQKLSTKKFSEQDKKDLFREFKRRNIAYRMTEESVLFDERFLKDVKDIIPPSLR